MLTRVLSGHFSIRQGLSGPLSYLWILLSCIALGWATPSPVAHGQLTLSGLAPQALAPAKTTRVELTGNQLKSPLRLGGTVPLVVQWVSIEATKAVADISVPANVPLGPATLWIASDESISEPLQILVDDLPSVADNAANHSKSQSQTLIIPIAVDGRSDATLSDYYQIHLAANASVSVDCIAERIGSTMDSVLRIWDAQGKLLVQADDRESSTDSLVRFRAPADGDYLVELVDNRFAGDGRYRLRISDSPSSPIPYPLAIGPNAPTTLAWILADGSVLKADNNPDQWSLTTNAPVESVGNRWMVGPTSPAKPGGFWSDVLVRDIPLYSEPIESEAHNVPAQAPLTLPAGITGRITTPNQTDLFAITGTQGQTIQIQSFTRSLGLPTLLKIALVHPNGNVVAETAITESDEWQLEAIFPESGTYQIRATELLGNSGPKYAYFMEAKLKPPFVVGMKPDPKSSESRLLESGAGAAWIDIAIQRSAYDGPIQLELVAPPPGLRILNPTVPAKVNEFRLYLATDPSWDPNRIGDLRWTAKQLEGGAYATPINSLGLRRTK
ncbi:MAG: PPC domain-containing protein, partial [Pirellula sp.]